MLSPSLPPFSSTSTSTRPAADAAACAQPSAGSASDRPASRGEILQADWTPFGAPDSYRQPWLNARIGVQYTHYDRFNGGTTNYDGFDRSAGDNDTLFVFVWTAI